MSDARAGRVGTLVNGKWHIDARIGSGGMATVYSATDRNGRRAAIKMLHTQLSRDASTRARFLREGYAASAVRHPGVVAVLEDGVAEDGSAFLVLELLEGETLDGRRQRLGGTLPLDEVLDFADQALDALAAAHENGVIHRDVKPDNFFVTKEGRLKLLDFGLARMNDMQAESTKTGVTIGTPEFMPPEQARGRRDSVDARSDIWGMGATLFNALTGHYVHDEAATIHEQLVASATQRPRPVRQVAPHVPPSVARVIDRALELEMSDRWPSASEMQRALRAAHSSHRGESPSRVVTHDKLTKKQPVVSFADADIEETFVDEGRGRAPHPSSARGRGGWTEDERTSRFDASHAKGTDPTARVLGFQDAPRAPLPPPTASRPPPRASFVPAPPVDQHGVPSVRPRALTPEETMEPTIATYLPTPPQGSKAPPVPAVMNPPSPAYGRGTGAPPEASISARASAPSLRALPRPSRDPSGRTVVLVAIVLGLVCLAMGAYLLLQSSSR